VRKVTPGSVCNAFSGLMPGRTFWISTPDTWLTERVVAPVTTMSLFVSAPGPAAV
jgi:hypothetical protein